MTKILSYKRLILLLISAFMIGACAEKQEYVIFGNVDKQYEGAEVYVLNEENRREKLDSTVVKDGWFRLQGEVKQPILAVIVVKSETGKRVTMNCVLEKGVIELDMFENVLKGTLKNDALHELNTACEMEVEALEMLYSQYMTAVSEEERKAIELKYDSVNELYNDKYLITALCTYNSNKDNILGAYSIYKIIETEFQRGNMTSHIADSLLQNASSVVVNFAPTKNIVETIRNMEKTSVGKHYIDLELLENVEQTPTLLSKYIDGKVALIDFWASWCGPCRNEMPNLANIHKKYSDKGLVVVGLNVLDKPAAQQKTIETMNMTWIQLLDTTTQATNVYGINSIPQIMLIGADGTILARNLRGEDVEAAVVEALK